jgi:hypothetical protein
VRGCDRPLLAKLRYRKKQKNKTKVDRRRNRLSGRRVFIGAAVLVLVEVGIQLAIRVMAKTVPARNFCVASHEPIALYLHAGPLGFKAAVLLLALWWCITSRHVKSQYHESKFLTLMVRVCGLELVLLAALTVPNAGDAVVCFAADDARRAAVCRHRRSRGCSAPRHAGARAALHRAVRGVLCRVHVAVDARHHRGAAPHLLCGRTGEEDETHKGSHPHTCTVSLLLVVLNCGVRGRDACHCRRL